MVEADVESEVHVKSCQRVLLADGSRNQGAPSYREENVRLRVRRAGFSKSQFSVIRYDIDFFGPGLPHLSKGNTDPSAPCQSECGNVG